MVAGVIGERLPDGTALAVLALKPALVLATILYFAWQGSYPEWRGQGARLGVVGGLQDVAVGLLLTLVWVLPYWAIPSLRPEPGGEFDPEMAGAALVPVVLGLRLFGYALVTPIFEELFIRSFVMRIADVYDRADFRDQPIARYTPWSMLVTAVIFTAGHVPWEWWVCVPWIVLSNLWFYRRRSLTSIMLVHGVTNAALLGLAVFGEGWLHDTNGEPFSFWFFV